MAAPDTSQKPTQSVTWDQTVTDLITNHLNTHFSSTLAKETDIVNIVRALMFLESSGRGDAAGPSLPLASSSIARDYWNSPTIVSARQSANQIQLANIQQGLRAWGLMQVGGWNLIRGATAGGKTEIEVSRPDLASQLMLNPGDSLSAVYGNPAEASRQILAGLVMLESKYKRVTGSGIEWKIGRFTFNSRISGSVAAYLGLGAKDVVTGITPQQYANSIVYGDAYKRANGKESPFKQSASNPSAQRTRNGPSVTTGGSGRNKVPVGC